jgi:hypothetical protein
MKSRNRSPRENQEEFLQVQVPSVTKRDLGIKAVQARQSMRVIVLQALKAYGVSVPANAISDRRRERAK